MKILPYLFIVFCLFSCKNDEKPSSKLEKSGDNIKRNQDASKTNQLIKTEAMEDSIPQQSTDFKGIWVRSDLITTIKNTHSLYKTKQLLSDKIFDQFLALVITDEDSKKDTLIIYTSTFETQMPGMLYMGINQKNHLLGYFAFATEAYENYIFYLDIVGSDLILTVQFGNNIRKMGFQKISEKPQDEYFGLVSQTYRYLLTGNYQLLDKNNIIIHNQVWFDERGNTNFLQFKKYDVGIGYWNSIHGSKHIKEKTENEKNELIKNGALTTQDILYLYNNAEDRHDAKILLVVESVKDGFNIYSVKEKPDRIWQLLYKKELIYRLVKNNDFRR